LVRAEKKKNRYASTRKLGIPDAEGSFAYSRFELLEHKGELALIRCIPVTGRTHQLRVHLSEYGLPIVGDRLYGAKRTLESPGRLMLHSYRLAFREEDGREIALEAPVPGEFKRLFDLKSL
jgi:23S rRNA-/tRNA-specific pseudouridylate synthase